VQILGVSTDGVEANAAFATKNDFPYPLLCDTDRSISLTYGATDSVDGKAKRITYVIDGEGTIIQVHAEVDARTHPETLLESVED
jgi:peroxiredoxin Q/BCP